MPHPSMTVRDLIFSHAEIICTEIEEEVDLEKKILLSIAIRLKAEEYAIERISDTAFLNKITVNQTAALISRFKKDFPVEARNIAILDQVMIMTPDNIHINSFMYEPILDMANSHLKSLYEKVKSLSSHRGYVSDLMIS